MQQGTLHVASVSLLRTRCGHQTRGFSQDGVEVFWRSCGERPTGYLPEQRAGEFSERRHGRSCSDGHMTSSEDHVLNVCYNSRRSLYMLALRRELSSRRHASKHLCRSVRNGPRERPCLSQKIERKLCDC